MKVILGMFYGWTYEGETGYMKVKTGTKYVPRLGI